MIVTAIDEAVGLDCPAQCLRVFIVSDPAEIAKLPVSAAVARLFERALGCSRFTGAAGESVEVVSCDGQGADRYVAVGAGAQGAQELERAGACAWRAAETTGARVLQLWMGSASVEAAASVAYGAAHAAYQFHMRTTPSKPAERRSVEQIQLVHSRRADVETVWKAKAGLLHAVNLTRDLVSAPANQLTPAIFAERLTGLVATGLEVEVLSEDELRRLGMGALLAVGQGSAEESKVVVLSWHGADAHAAPLALVGKGVCFDSGGLSIKPCEHMADMKWDMAGAAAIAGGMLALATRNAKVNVVGVLGLVENMPDGAALRPGDVITTLSGKTVEVIDTDAEGRLVLSDLLAYAGRRFSPAAIIDLATLTGAVAIALADTHAGLFSNNDEIASALLSAGEKSGEALWRLPLAAGLRREIESPIADLKNYGAREGGAISAALFLQEFVENRPWAHIDMAAMAWRSKNDPEKGAAGATGFGVRLIDRFAAGYEC